MVDFGQATYIDGTVIPGSELRRVTQRDTGDGSGVVRPGDLKITQMSVPGAGVRIAVGDVLIQSRAPSAGRETYGGALTTAQNYLGDAGTGIPGTGSSVPPGGRRDMVFVEVLDSGLPTFYTPQGEWPVGQSLKLSIIQNVGAAAQSIEDVPALANVTGYALAIITYPASTATITNAMITDIRVLQNPRRDGFTFARPRVGGDSGPQMYLAATMAPLPATGGELFPGGGGIPNRFQIKVPTWATRMALDAKWMSLFYAASQNPRGRYWMEYGDEWRGDKSWPGMRQLEFATQEFAFNAPAIADVSSDNWQLMDEVPIPAKLRGKTIWIAFKAARAAGNATSVVMNSTGGLGCTGVFAERAIDADLL